MLDVKKYFNLIFVFALFFVSCSKYSQKFNIFQVHAPKPSAQKLEKSFDITQIYKQITTHPEVDLYPAISPDGKWLAFSSKRSGNMDIWIKPVSGGSATQITTHKADDIMPVWSPDGKKLAFVSFRDDALGDIWELPIKKLSSGYYARGKPRRVTNYLGQDISPVYSPDGKFIAFCSNRNGVQNIYLLNLRNKKVFQITSNGAIQPTWSPDGKRIAFVSFRNPGFLGKIFYVELSFKKQIPKVESEIPVSAGFTNDAFPNWGCAEDQIFFTRYNKDTNNDGKISPDDRPELWKVVLKLPADQKKQNEDNDQTRLSNQKKQQSNKGKRDLQLIFQEIKLTPGLSYDYYPVCAQDSLIYFVSRQSGNDDIFAMSVDGGIPKQTNAFFQYHFALTYFQLPVNDLIYHSESTALNSAELQYRLMAFNRVLDFFPEDHLWVGWSLYEIARTYQALGEIKLAKAYYQEILTQFSHLNELIQNTKLQLFQLDLENGTAELTRQLQYLDEIIQHSTSHSSLQATAQLFKGELLFLNNRYSRAITELEKLIRLLPDEDGKCARAQLLIGDIFSIYGQTDEVIGAYLKVVKNYPHQQVWVNLAIEKILELQNQIEVYETISSYRKLIMRYSEYRRLAAKTHLKIAELYLDQEDYDAAIEESSLILNKYADQKEEVAEAEILLAKIYVEKNDDLRAIKHLKNVVYNFGTVRSGLYVVKAKEFLLDIYLKSGNEFRSAGEIQASYQRYRSAVELFPRNIDANRGIIASMYMLHRIDEAIKIYENLLAKFPGDETYLYLLGLCYSYKATEKSDRTKDIRSFNIKLMKYSNELIEKALSKNYRIIQAYLTLSYNYEFIEKYEVALRQQQSGFLKSFLTTVVTPLKSLVRWLTLQKEEMPEQWYEKAIDALTTAIALNDESANPLLESELALNLASNYYNLKEFGFERAYYYYQKKLQYDSTFAYKRTEAEVFRKMGHCALVVGDFKNGPKYLKKAMDLYKSLGDEDKWLMNVKRLALLYQLSGDYDQSVEYFKIAAKVEEKRKNYNQLQIDYRSIAYNFMLLNDEEEAVHYAKKALDLINSGKTDRIKAKPNWIKIGILGVEFPIWNLGHIGTGESTAAGGFTTDEEIALIYSILGYSALERRSIKEAIKYLEKKLEIYRKREDSIAEAIFLNNIGYLYYLDRDYENAWDFYVKSLKICEKEENIPGFLINSINLGGLGVLLDKLCLLDRESNSINANEKYERIKIFHDNSLKYLHKAVKIFDEAFYGFDHEKVQAYNLLGVLHFLESQMLNISNEKNQINKIKNQLLQFERWAIADSCFNQALNLCNEKGFEYEKILILQNIGNLTYLLGDVTNAIDYFVTARKDAIKNNYLSCLWEVDFALGQLLSQSKEKENKARGSRDAGYYLNEAVDALETSAMQLKVFRPGPLYQYRVRRLYEVVVENFVLSGNRLTALRFTERFRGKRYIDNIGRHKLQLKKERHKIFLGNARFLKNEIDDLENKIRMEKEQNKHTKRELMLWIKQKRNYEDEYYELVQKLKSEDPELEAFINTEPVTYPQIQEILTQDKIILDYFIVGNRLYIWSISSDSVKYYKSSIDKAEINILTEKWLNREDNDNEKRKVVDRLWEIFIEPVDSEIASHKTIIFIPDEGMNRLPFNFLVNFCHKNEYEFRNVTIAPRLASYYYSYYQRKIKGYKLLATDTLLDTLFDQLGYDVIKFSPAFSKGEIDKQFRNSVINADLVFLVADIKEKSEDPLLSEIVPHNISFKHPFVIKDIYSMDLSSSLFILSAPNKLSSNLVNVLGNALSYAGAPSIIIAQEESLTQKFWEYFYDYLLDYSICEAVARTQNRMKNEGFLLNNYASFAVLGFEGMTNEQETQFAQERFRSKVAIGNKYYEEEKWEDAIKIYEQALIMAKKQGDRTAINNLYQLILYCAANGGLWDKAIEYQSQLVEQAEEAHNVQRLIEELRYLIYFYTQNQDYDKAIEYQKKYLALSEDYGLTENVGYSYRRLGLVFEKSGDYEKATDYFSRAISEFRERGDSLKVAECLKDRGRIYLLYLDHYSRAIEDQDRALKIFQAVGNYQNFMELLQNLGLSHERLGNYQTALEYQNRAYLIAKKLKLPLWIALSQQHLANVNWKMGNYLQALQFQKNALETFSELGELKFQAIGFSTNGLIMMSLGDLQKALELENKALELAEEIGDRQNIATIHKNISLIYRSLNQWEEAMNHLTISLEIDQKVGSERGLSYDYRDLGVIKLQQGKIDEAFSNFRKALNLSKKIYDGRNLTQCLYEIGSAYMASGDFKAAIDTLEIAVDNAEKLFVPEVEWRAYRKIGQVYKHQGNYEASMKAFQFALEIIETMRAKIKVDEYKSGFIDDKLDVYHDLIDLYQEMKLPGKAIEIVERAKSRNFIDLLANKDIQFRGELNQEILKKKKEIQEEIRRFQSEIARLKIREDQITFAESEKLKKLALRLNDLKKNYQQILVRIKEQNPELSSMITVSPESIESYQSMLPDSVILLEYFYTDNRLYIWAVSNNKITARIKDYPGDLLFSKVDTLRKSIERRLPLHNISTDLYRLLIKPVESELEDFKHLVIIPHGILHYLPFSALIDNNGAYLIEKYSISLSPSAMVLKICLEKGDAFIGDKNWTPKVLAFGNPELGDPRFELPFADKEVESIKLLFSNVDSYLGKEARETLLKTLSPKANLFLFSCHGEFDSSNPLFSALLLTPDKQNDGRLEAHEIFSLKMDAYLVAMSACETGLAKIGVGDEVIGLSRSFIYAGSSSLLSSLWKVDDLATAVMIKRFFRYLKGGASRATALQQAVIFVKNNINEHPLFWAAFNITGDFR